MKHGLSLHMMVKNPPIDRMAALVGYVQPFASEIVIVDTGTNNSDRSVMESWDRQGGVECEVRIIDAPFVDFSWSRNRGLAEHRYDWTLVLDPDELPSVAMMAHVAHVTRYHDDCANQPDGWAYWTFNWWSGRLGPFEPYHWHTRLFKTEGSYFYRPVHELLVVTGTDEITIRGTERLPFAPAEAYLIHSKGGADIEEADKLYERLGEVSR